MSKKSNKTPAKRRPWKKHKQVLITTSCGVRVEVDAKLAHIIRYLNMNHVETRHSCQGRKPFQAYISMFATPRALGLAHYLVDHGGEARVHIERDIHPNGYENLTLRWPSSDQEKFEDLVHKYFQ